MDDENYSRPKYSHNISQSCWGDLDIHVPVGRLKRVLDVDVQIRLDKTKTQLGLEMVEDPTKLFCCSPKFLGDDDLGTTISYVFQASRREHPERGVKATWVSFYRNLITDRGYIDSCSINQYMIVGRPRAKEDISENSNYDFFFLISHLPFHLVVGEDFVDPPSFRKDSTKCQSEASR